MKRMIMLSVLFFTCAIQASQPAEKTNPKPMTGQQIVSDFVEEAIRQGYPIVKKKMVNWMYQQMFSAQTPVQIGLAVGGSLQMGLAVGAGVAVTGLTIFVMYKVYDKYLRHELTKEQTEQEVAAAIYTMVMDELTYPTYSAKIHVLLKKDEFLNYLNDTDAIFFASCNQVIDRITALKNSRNSVQDAAIDKKMNEILRPVATALNEKKLEYVTNNYIGDKNKFDPFTYLTIILIEEWTNQIMSGSLSEKEMNALNARIIVSKEHLLSSLTVEQRAAYALYLRFKNKVAVEKLLSPEQKALRNPFESLK